MGLTAGYIASLALTSASVISSERQRSVQKKGLRQQEQAQREAQSSAISQQRLAEQENRKANRRKPDIDRLLGESQLDAKTGAASTLLTGPTSGKPLLAKKSLLGA